MTVDEINVLKRHISPPNAKSKPKTLHLVELILGTVRFSDASIRKKVSPTASDNAFATLVSDLKKKINESLILNINLNRKGQFSEVHKHKFQGKKQLMAVEILLRKGLSTEAYFTLDKIISKAKTFELFDILREALTLKLNFNSLRSGTDSRSELKRELEHFQNKERVYQKARMLYYELSARVGQTALINEQNEIKKELQELTAELKVYPSDNAWYYIAMVDLYFLQFNGQFDRATTLLDQVLIQIKTSKPLSMARRIGKTYIEMADNYLMAHEPQKALNHVEEAIGYLKKGNFNYQKALEYALLSKIHLGERKGTNSLSKKLIALTSSEESPFSMGKRKYFQACMYFMKERYGSAEIALGECGKLYEDKAGWNISLRILEIMNQICLGGLGNKAEKRIENLKDHIYKTKKLKSISKRNLAILEVLKALVNEGFDFTKIKEDKADVLTNLASGEGDFAWSMTSPELIRFEAWFFSRVKHTSYRFDLVA